MEKESADNEADGLLSARQIANLVSLYLQNENFVVFQFYNAADTLKCIQSEALDLAILDVMLPDMNGFQLCREIREKYQYPVIMLTAKGEETDKITGLTLGADDYITKPFLPLELVARVKAQPRRYKRYNGPINEDEKDIIIHSGLVLNIKTHECTLNEKPLSLTPTEFSILQILCRNIGNVVSAEELFHQIWKDEYFSKSNNTITVHIRHLRKKWETPLKNLSISKPFGGADIKLKSKLLKLSGVIFIFAVCVMLCFALYYLIDDTLNGSFVNWFDENYIITIEKDLTGLPVQNAPERRLNYPKIKELLLQVLVVSVTAWIAIVLTVAHFYSRSREKRSVTAVSRMIQRFMNTDTDVANIFPKEYAEISAQMTEIKSAMQRHEQRLKEETAGKNDLITYLAHDLKTPLTSVIGYLSLLDEAPDMPVQQRTRYVHIIWIRPAVWKA